MLRSMTAYARQEVATEWGRLTWELRSVNHRYLETSMRMPEELRQLEGSVREKVAKYLKRGKVECNLRLQRDGVESTEIDMNAAMAQKLVAAAQSVREMIPDAAAINPLDVLKWPGVLQSPEMDLDSMKKAVMDLLDETLKDMVQTREREGEKLKEMIATRAETMVEISEQVKLRIPHVLKHLHERLASRLEEFKAQLDSDRLEQEMVMQAQRIDVDEELDRLLAHLQEVNRVLAQKGPVGRRLDFLMQELNREANTLGSKSADTETTKASVEMKVLIEQMREQVQNIE